MIYFYTGNGNIATLSQTTSFNAVNILAAHALIKLNAETYFTARIHASAFRPFAISSLSRYTKGRLTIFLRPTHIPQFFSAFLS